LDKQPIFPLTLFIFIKFIKPWERDARTAGRKQGSGAERAEQQAEKEKPSVVYINGSTHTHPVPYTVVGE
jgi:hypothetical protein